MGVVQSYLAWVDSLVLFPLCGCFDGVVDMGAGPGLLVFLLGVLCEILLAKSDLLFHC